MQVPEKRLCDLCKGELTGVYIVLTYPLDESDRARVRAQLPPAQHPLTLLGLAFDATPHSWRFDFCRGCVDGLIPMLGDLKTSAIKNWLDERQRRANAPVESDSDL